MPESGVDTFEDSTLTKFRNGDKIPSSTPTKTIIEKILKNPYYVGVVTYNGVEYTGNHEAIIDRDTFDKVQAILSAHINGERNREHPHYLKGSLFCRSCGSKMLVTYAKSKSGNIYPYFICAGRHNKKKAQINCTLKAILIEEVERQIEQIYDRYSFDPGIKEKLEETVQTQLDIEKEKFKVELDRLTREKEKIERRQEKLLEAHFNDAIPITLLKKEQSKLDKQLAVIEHDIKAYDATFEEVTEKISLAFDLIEDCGNTYRMANDNIKRLMNQALFEKIWIEEDGHVTTEFTNVYKHIAQPVINEIASRNTQKTACDESHAVFITKLLKSYSNFFGKGLNNEFLVDLAGVEPASESPSTRASPITVIILTFPPSVT